MAKSVAWADGKIIVEIAHVQCRRGGGSLNCKNHLHGQMANVKSRKKIVIVLYRTARPSWIDRPNRTARPNRLFDC